MKKIYVLLAALLFIATIPMQAQSYTLLHTFTSSSCNSPRGNLVLSGSHLYGMANSGGANNVGCIFTVDTNGNGYRDLFDFDQATGNTPEGSLIIKGSTLYGMVATGGEYKYTGGIFYIDTDGTHYGLMHSFGGPNDGTTPVGQLLLVGNTLFGVTEEGGANDDGIVFSIHTDSSNYKILYNFTGGATGGYPVTSLAVKGNSLYGVTQTGGASSEGCIYSIDTNGANETVLYSFPGLAYSFTTPFIIGNTIYGTESLGGIGLGSIFSMQTNGSNFTTIFSSGSNTPNGFKGDLLLMGGKLYGACPNTNSQSSSDAAGSLYSIDTSGGTANTLFYFTDTVGSYIGADPFGGLVNAGSTLFGTGTTGGTQHDGVIFKCSGSTPAGINRYSAPTNSVVLYPNPANTEVNISVSGNCTAANLEIYDITGRSVGAYSLRNNFLTINTQSFTSGLYIYKLFDGSGNQLNVGKFNIVK